MLTHIAFLSPISCAGICYAFAFGEPEYILATKGCDKKGHIVDWLTFEVVLEKMPYALILLVEIIDVA